MLPRAVLYDPQLSAEAKIAYAVMRDMANAKDSVTVTVALATLGQRLGRSESSARRARNQLIDRNHVAVIGKPSGRAWIYTLTHVSDARGGAATAAPDVIGGPRFQS